ncbi:hypothetical protein [Brytella acorum]|uniref:Uncharacterized protein n=1 Tax=Brytella acorum TaxID=2959299 RepID=A0AA35Y1A3_9PROT|nr:hypothetical protein [Brytella acorum]MDF3623342.1 hypothetical protein [Brytella acorum]CAI9120421.1 hypothetical protein LMG32879_001253 [Brytella acorum]
MSGKMTHNPLSPPRLETAKRIVHQGHLKGLELSKGKAIQMSEALWRNAQRDKAFRLALVRLMIATSQVATVSLSEAKAVVDQGDAEHGPHSGVTMTPAILAEHNPLSEAKVHAAREVFASAMLRAAEAKNGDVDASRQLVWAWARQDAELETAMVRLGCMGINLIWVVLPDPVGNPETLH